MKASAGIDKEGCKMKQGKREREKKNTHKHTLRRFKNFDPLCTVERSSAECHERYAIEQFVDAVSRLMD